MFFDDEDLAPKVKLTAPPPVPDTGWRRPTEFPDLTRARVIAFDVETKEPDFDHGPGWARGNGHIVGVSVCALDAHNNKFIGYYPVRHEVGSKDNFHPKQVFDWLRVQLQTPNIPKVGANLVYDIGWMTEEDIYVEGELHDVQFAEALLNESGQVNLEWLGQKYLGEGKASNAMYDWIDAAYRPSKKKRRGEIYRTPPSLVGHYAESDAELPIRVLEKQWPLLQSEALDFIYRIECDLIYLLVRMRIAGVSVNVGIAEQMRDKLTQEINILYGKLSHLAGRAITGVNSPDQLAPIFDAAGMKYPRTPTGKPSFTKDWLKACQDPAAALVNSIREMEKLRGTFIEGTILDRHRGGKIYPNFHPLRSDSGGARSGRFSSSNPNAQQIPARTDLGKQIRGMFVPDYGHACWEKDDYSQIEYRFLCHFAVGPGSDEVRKQYNDDPDTDYHEHTQQIVKQVTGLSIARKPIKTINFGLCIAKGQRVTTDKGLVPIEEVERRHLLWDGQEWVAHSGVVDNGTKEVINYGGLTATPDHVVWTRQGRPVRLGLAASQGQDLCAVGSGIEAPRHWHPDTGLRRHTGSVRLSRALHPLGDDAMAGKRFQGFRLRQARQRWTLQPGKLTACNEKRQPVKSTSQVYDIIDAGPRNCFVCESVLVHNCYGMGKPKLKRTLNVGDEEGDAMFEAYHTGAPYVKATMDATAEEAQQLGYIVTILGRRSRFELWEPRDIDYDNRASALPYKEAIACYGSQIQRAYAHKAINRRLQGSAADQMKYAMWKAWKAGIFDVIGVPRLTVHDELDFSVVDDTKEQRDGYAALHHELETCIQLRVPVRIDFGRGPSWGSVE